MSPHQWKQLIVEIQIRLLAAMLVLMGFAVLLTVIVVLLRWAGVPC